MKLNKPYTELLNELLKNNPFLIVAHRGLGRANIVENTIASMQACFLAGADVVEADVICSRDGHFYMIHDEEEARLFGKKMNNIRTLSSAEISELRYKNQLGEACNAKVESFFEFIQALPDNRMINLDRGWFNLPELLVHLDGFDIAQRLLLKTNATLKDLKIVASHPKKYMYLAICRSVEDITLAISMQQQGVNLVGLELIADHAHHPFLQPDYIHQLKEKGYVILVNTLNIDSSLILWGDFDDDRSVTAGPEHGWGEVIKQGVNMINTDWPALMANYRSSLNKV